MKRIVFLVVLYATAAVAQTGNPITLQLGTVTVWLGMDKSVLTQQIEAAGMRFGPGSTDTDALVLDHGMNRLYNLRFTNGKLSFAGRDWFNDQTKALPSVIDALTSLIDEGATDCTIKQFPINNPDTKGDRVAIQCGQRGILLVSATGTVDGKPFIHDSILETIGR